MLQNTSPQTLIVHRNLLFCSNKMQQCITMTANDAKMKVIIWIHIFPSSNHVLRLLKSFIFKRLSNT